MSDKDWTFFCSAYELLVKELVPLGCQFRYQDNYIKSNYYTPTPQLTITIGSKYIGFIMFDKDMCSPRRYFSYYTGVTGGHGFYGHPTLENLVRTFKLIVTLSTPGFDTESVLTEGQALGILERSIKYYFPR